MGKKKKLNRYLRIFINEIEDVFVIGGKGAMDICICFISIMVLLTYVVPIVAPMHNPSIIWICFAIICIPIYLVLKSVEEITKCLMKI